VQPLWRRCVPIPSRPGVRLLFVVIATVLHSQVREVALGDDRSRQASNAANPLEPPQRISLSFAPNSGAANAVVGDSLRAKADDIVDSSRLDGDSEEAGRVIELRKNVRLWLNDGSVKAMADEAVITPKYRDGSKKDVESFDVKLSGNVRWKSREFAAWANELTVSLRPVSPGDLGAPRFSELALTGRARLAGDEFKGKADRIKVDFVQVNKPPADRSMRLTLDGSATIVLGRPGDNSRPPFYGGYMQFIPENSSLKIDQARIGSSSGEER
jgi:hypothetical protein